MTQERILIGLTRLTPICGRENEILTIESLSSREQKDREKCAGYRIAFTSQESAYQKVEKWAILPVDLIERQEGWRHRGQ